MRKQRANNTRAAYLQLLLVSVRLPQGLLEELNVMFVNRFDVVQLRTEFITILLEEFLFDLNDVQMFLALCPTEAHTHRHTIFESFGLHSHL